MDEKPPQFPLFRLFTITISTVLPGGPITTFGHLPTYFSVKHGSCTAPFWLEVCALWAWFAHICAIFTPELDPLSYVNLLR